MLGLMELRRGRTCVFNLHAHLVFVTKYRRGVLTDDMIDYAKEIFADVCEDFDAVLVECDGQYDHMHLLIEYPPTVQLTRLVNSLKGVSSRYLRKRWPNI